MSCIKYVHAYKNGCTWTLTLFLQYACSYRARFIHYSYSDIKHLPKPDELKQFPSRYTSRATAMFVWQLAYAQLGPH